jgi:hypothetical protein
LALSPSKASVQLYFRGEKLAKVMGSLAVQKPQEGMKVSGILVKRNFNYHILAPADLPKYTDLTMSTVTQVPALRLKSVEYAIKSVYVYKDEGMEDLILVLRVCL